MRTFTKLLASSVLMSAAAAVRAAETEGGETLALSDTWLGVVSIVIFVAAYALVISEEFTQLRKSKPVMAAAGLIWALIAFEYARNGLGTPVEHAVEVFLVEFSELF